MTIRIPLEITSGGNNKAVADILAIQRAIQETANEADSIRELAESLGTTYKQAKQLSSGMGLTAEKSTTAVAMLRQLNAVNADTATKFQVLLGKLNLTATQFNKLDQAVEKSAKGTKDFSVVLQGVGQGIGSAGFGLVSSALGSLPSTIASNTLQFEKFRTVLNTLYGDAGKAQAAFDTIQNFAATTPFQLDEVLGAFIKLKNRGIDPTNDTLRNLGDLAASQGKGLDQMVEAILDASTGEFERLKEFGIKASDYGNQVALTFKGVTKVIDDTPEAINNAILGFGQLKGVAGGMEAQSKTLGGQLSNLQDNVTKVAVSFGTELLPPLVEFISEINNATGGLDGFAKSAGQFVAQGLTLLGQGMKVVKDNSKLLEITLQLLIARLVILRAIALYGMLVQWAAGFVAAQTAAGAATVGTVGLTGALTGLRVALLANLPLLLAVGGAVAAIQAFQFANGLKQANEELDSLGEAAKVGGDAALSLASKMKAINDARAQGVKFSTQDIAKQKQLAEVGKQQIAGLQKQLAETKAIQPANEEQRIAQEALIKNYEASISALEKQTAALEAGANATAKAADDVQTLAKNVKDAEGAMKLLDRITKELDLGKLSEREAIAALEAIKNNAKSGAEAQKKASQEIVKIRQNQISAEIAKIQAGQAEIDALKANGRISEATADQEITDLKVKELDKQVQANREAINATNSPTERAKLLAEERKLLAERSKINAEFRERENQRRLQDFDEQRKILEGSLSQGNVSQASFNKRLAAINQQQSDEEIRQIREKQQEMSAADKEGQEQLSAQLGEALKKRAQLQQEAYQRDIALLNQYLDEANDAVVLAETQRSIAIQQMVNDETVTVRQADEMRLTSAQDRLNEEIDLEKKKLEQLEKTQKLSDPQAEAQRQNDIREQTQKTADLRLKSLELQAQKEQQMRDAAIAAIQFQQQQQQIANDRAVLGLEKQRNIQEAISRSLDRQLKLQQSAANLTQALTNRRITGLEGELSLIDRARQLRQQAENEQDPNKKLAIQNALNKLGIQGATDEMSLLTRKQEIENQIAAQKQIQRDAEFRATRLQRELEMQRDEIAAKRAVQEAKIAELKAQQAVSDAQSAIAEAEQIKDPEERAKALAAAQQQLDRAQQDLGQATQVRQEQEQALADQQALAAEARQALAVQQQTEQAAAAYAERLRLANQELERGVALAEQLAAANKKASDSTPLVQVQARREGGDVQPGNIYSIAEDAPELLRVGNSWHLAASPALIKVGAPGMVFNAADTAAMLSRLTPTSAAVSTAFSSDRAVVDEIKGLRQDLRENPIRQEATFNLNNQDDSLRKTLWLQEQMMLSRYRR